MHFIFALFFSVSFLLTSGSFKEALASSSSSRSPGTYLDQTKGRERVLVIGGGHAYGYDHPLTHFLVDINKEHKPDYEADITKRASLPDGFINKFDVVVWENVDTTHFVKDETLLNILSVLKSGGRLITGFLCASFPMNETIRHNKSLLPLRRSVGLFAFEPNGEEWVVPFIVYYDQTYINTLPPKLRGKAHRYASTQCFDQVFKPWLEGKGFTNVDHIFKSSYWRAENNDEGYIQATKP